MLTNLRQSRAPMDSYRIAGLCLRFPCRSFHQNHIVARDAYWRIALSAADTGCRQKQGLASSMMRERLEGDRDESQEHKSWALYTIYFCWTGRCMALYRRQRQHHSGPPTIICRASTTAPRRQQKRRAEGATRGQQPASRVPFFRAARFAVGLS